MGIFLLFLGLLLEPTQTYAQTHAPYSSSYSTPCWHPHIHMHTHRVKVISNLHMCIRLIVPLKRWCAKNRFLIGRTIQTEKPESCSFTEDGIYKHERGITGCRQTFQIGHGNPQQGKHSDGWDSHVSISFTEVDQRKARSLGNLTVRKEIMRDRVAIFQMHEP